MTITIADGRGALWQWDTGRRVKITDGDGVKQVHYQNKCFGRSVDVDVGADGTAIIPDELLQDYHTLTAYAYVTDDAGGYTKVQQDFAVYKRAKPADYVYTPTEHAGFDRLRDDIGDLADLTTEAKENLVEAINEAAASCGSGSMDLRVADGYIQYSADSGMTWTNLIAVSDLKGDTGAPGKDGAGMDVTGATVGQIAKIAAVDASGVPTAWSPADMPSGGSSDFVINGTVTGETLTTDKTYEQVQEAVQAGKRVTLKVKVYGIDFVLSRIGESSIGYLFATAATIVPGLIAQFTAAVGQAGQNLFVKENVVSYDSDGNLMQVTMDSDPSQPMEIATKQYVDASGVPSVTDDDNGKFLRVVSGAWAAATINDANGVSF